MRHPDLYILHWVYIFAPVLFLGMMSCNDDSVEPGPFNYPIELATSTQDHGIQLDWNKTTVSSFVEYIIVRSPDSIVDTPEPELDGQAVIVERIDLIDQTQYIDYEYPIATTHFYKVYADIGDRFLMSATRRVDVDLQLIPLRVDVLAADTDKNVIVGYDRGIRAVFTYDYSAKEVLAQQVTSMNNPILKIGSYNGSDEIYLCDRSSLISIRDRNTLFEKGQLWLNQSSPQDFDYDQGKFVVTLNSVSTTNVHLYDRGTLGFRNGASGLATDFRFLTRGNNAEGLFFYEFSSAGRTKYQVVGNVINVVEHAQTASSGVLMPARHPSRDEFVISSAGQVINGDLDNVALLGTGSLFYNVVAYSHDGQYVAASRFANNETLVEIFDVGNGFNKVKSIPVNFSPNFMFGDDNFIYATGLVFFGGATQTVLLKIRLPQ